MMKNDFEMHRAPAPEAEAEALLDAAFGLSRRTRSSYRLREGSASVAGLNFHLRHAGSGRLAGLISFWPLRVHPAGPLKVRMHRQRPQQQRRRAGRMHPIHCALGYP